MTQFLGKATGMAMGLAMVGMSPALAQTVPPLEQQLDLRGYGAARSQALALAEDLVEAGDQALREGREEDAIAAWQQALEIYSSVGDRVGVETTTEALIKVLIAEGRFEEAEGVVQKQLTLAREQRDVTGLIYGLNNLGTVHLQQGEFSQAQNAFVEALELAQNRRNSAGIGLSLSNLGSVARLQGNLGLAREYYEEATAFRLQAGDDVGLAHTSNLLGKLYRELGDDRKAIGAFGVARRTALEVNHVPTLLAALDGLVAIYADRDDVEQVRTYIGERTVLTAADAPPEQQLGLYVGLGRYYEQLEDYGRAQLAYQEALAIADALNDTASRTYILNRLQGLVS